MDWSAFWTLVFQASIIIAILLVLWFVGTAVVAGVRAGQKNTKNPRKQKRDRLNRSDDPKDN